MIFKLLNLAVNLTQLELRKIARKRVGFKRHLTIYIVVILFLGLINFFTSRHFPWFLFPAAVDGALE